MKGLFVVLLCVIAVASASPTTNQKRDAFGRLLGFPSGRVVGGHNATPPVPFIVSLVWRVISGTHLCGGAIISNEWVLTAAHCIRGVPGIGFFEARAGRFNIGLATEPTEQVRFADHNYEHPLYVGDVAPFDIALIHFPVPFVYGASVSAAVLPVFGSIPSGQVDLFGWGSTSTTQVPSMPDILQTVNKPIISMVQCENAFGGPGASPLHETNLCTGPLTGGVSACSGDSGGPLMQGNIVVGIVSWGVIPCGTVGAPSVYVRVSAFNDWIAQIIAQHTSN